MIHYGQGKWYPGEPLPRWQYGLFWRKDLIPVWKNSRLIAQEKTPRIYTVDDARKFIKELSAYLGINEENISTAYEDSFYLLWTEGRLPANIDPLRLDLKDPLERRTLTRVLDTGLDAPGYTLPLKWNYAVGKWQSCKWQLKRARLFLVPGNSPIGLRLPLDSLPVTAKEHEPQKVERSLFEELPALGDYTTIVNTRYAEKINAQLASTIEVDVIKTTLCTEVRDGILYIFLPPRWIILNIIWT